MSAMMDNEYGDWHGQKLPDEDDAPLSEPLTQASIDIVNSIINARVDESCFLRDYDE